MKKIRDINQGLSTKNKVLVDMMLNIIAVAIPVAVLQLIVYPFTATVIGDEKYGLMITIYSVWVAVSNTIGNALNNVKLLNNNEYIARNEHGDFIILFRRWNLVNVIIVIIITSIYSHSFNLFNILISGIIAIFFTAKSYLEVGFRIKLNYLGIVISNALQSLGYIIGCFITYKTSIWQSIFIFGYLFSVLFCIFKTKLFKESSSKTALFSKVQKETRELTLATVAGSMMNYADKLVLYPLMGPSVVSVYYTATILGKIVGMLTGPINSVILSYISRWDESKKNVLNKLLITGFPLSIVGYIFALVVAKPIIGALYPQWIDEVTKIMPYTTATIMLLVLISMINPFVLKYCGTKVQIIINGVGVCVYFIAAIILWKVFGLKGFCIGTVIGAVTKLSIMLIFYYKKLNKNKLR